MNDQYHAAQTQPSTRAWRFRRFFVVRFHAVGWFLKLLFLRLAYRHLMRLSHYFGWHYAPLEGPMENGDMYRWCHWCGMRGTVPNERRIVAEMTAARDDISSRQ